MSEIERDDNVFYGWFDDPEQARPTYDPPRDGPCLLCGKPITAGDVRTTSLMPLKSYGKRSYFYRVHRTCSDRGQMDTDNIVFGMIEMNGD